MKRFRTDFFEDQLDGARVGYTHWIGGPSLSEVRNCRLESLAGDMRANVYVTSAEPATFFSIGAVCSIKGCRVRGYLTGDGDGSVVFRHCYG
jgi:hypothetical protein